MQLPIKSLMTNPPKNHLGCLETLLDWMGYSPYQMMHDFLHIGEVDVAGCNVIRKLDYSWLHWASTLKLLCWAGIADCQKISSMNCLNSVWESGLISLESLELKVVQSELYNLWFACLIRWRHWLYLYRSFPKPRLPRTATRDAANAASCFSSWSAF